jgi:molecular chaperone IbpA
MSALDFSPLYRSTIGFDHVFDLLDSAMRLEPPIGSWPPCNIEKMGEDRYRVTVAVAGFMPDEITVTAEPNRLTVVGKKQGDNSGSQYLHRGIAARSFKQTFDLADHVVVNGAQLENGLLTIELAREVPEAMKPRRIEIRSDKADGQDSAKQIERPKAA